MALLARPLARAASAARRTTPAAARRTTAAAATTTGATGTARATWSTRSSAGSVPTVATLLLWSTLLLGFKVNAPARVGDALGQHLTAVDPHLDADAPERGLGLAKPVVDVGAQRVERDTTIGVVLGTRHLGTAETA